MTKGSFQIETYFELQWHLPRGWISHRSYDKLDEAVEDKKILDEKGNKTRVVKKTVVIIEEEL